MNMTKRRENYVKHVLVNAKVVLDDKALEEYEGLLESHISEEYFLQGKEFIIQNYHVNLA
jgi:hypothetical protein